MSDSDSGDAAATDSRKRLRKSVTAASDDESDFGGGEDSSNWRAKEPDSERPSPAGSESEGGVGRDQDGDDDEDLGSDDEEEEARKETTKKKRKKKKGDSGASSRKRVRDYVDDMAVDEDEGEDADDDEDEGEDNDYQYDDFVVGDVEDVGEGEAGREQRRKKKRTRLVKASAGQTLDEEDLALIAENAGMREGGDIGMARDMPADAPRRRRAVDADFDSEEDDFIVDDLGGYGRAAGGMRAPRRAGVEREEFEGGPTQEQVDEAMDIFGEMPPEFAVLAAAAGGGAPGSRAEAEKRRRAALARMEPAVLREYFITDEDHKVRETDRPERLQNRMKGRGEISDGERKEEADWIMPQLKFDNEQQLSEEMRAAVEKVLFYYQVERQEVPFVAHHRRDYFEPWLQRRHLWQIFELDEKWERLQARRLRVENTVTAMRRRMRGEADNEEDVAALAAEETYLSETEGEREERAQKERWAADDRATRLRRAEENVEAAKAAAEVATAARELGADAANAAATEAHAAAVAQWEKAFADHEAAATTLEARRRAAEGPLEMSLDDEEETMEEARQTEQKAVASALAALGPPPPRPDKPEECTAASLELAEAEALARLERAVVYLQGARGDAELEAAVEESRAAERLQRARERRDAKMKEYYERREKMQESTKDEAAMVPEDAYRLSLDATMDEQDIKDMQEYLALVTAPSSAGARHRRASQKDRESYSVYRRAGLRRYTSQFSVAAHVSGRAVDRGETVEVPTPMQDPKVFAAEAAEDLANQEENAMRLPPPSVSNPDLQQQVMLRAMHHMVAMELANEPSVRRKCRHIFRRRVVVTTKATARGSSEIDFFHPLFGLHYLRNKPAMDFIYARPGQADRTAFLQLEKAQREGLLVMRLHLPPRDEMAAAAAWDNDVAPRRDEADISPFLRELVPVFCPAGGVVEGGRLGTQKLWEAERAKILETALLSHILPQLEAELRAELRRMARAAVVEEAAAALARRLAVGPYADPGMSRLELLTRQNPELKVVGIAVAQEHREPSYAVALDGTGRVTDHLAMPVQREQLQAKMRQFLLAHRPDLVVVNTSAGQNSRRTGSMLLSTRHTGGGPSGFGEDVPLQTGLIPDLLNEKRHRRSARAARAREDDSDDEANGSDDEDEMGDWRCGMVHLRDDVARVFSMSKRGHSEFPDYHHNLRLAVGLARYAQDPLTELAGMWTTMDPSGNFGGEMLFLQLHPLQKEVARPALLRALEQTMMDAVSDVGVDLNEACEHAHLRGLLQFVPGLGPKKAAALRQAVGRGGDAVVGRQQLLEKKLMGHQVYTNAASFLRFRRRLQREGDDDEHIDGDRNPFDATRIHPECYTRYEWALKMCGNALEVEIDPDQASELVSSVMNDSYEAVESMLRAKPNWHPDAPGAEELEDKLSELDLAQYAADLEQHGLGKRLSQLELIKAEIRFPYRDRRTPLAPPTEAELFEMLTGESDATMRPGALVTCRVTGHVPGGVKVIIEGDAGLFGFVRGEFATDQQQEYGFADWESIVPRRQVREAAIMEVRKDRFELLLSLRQSELDRSPQGWGIKWSRPDSLLPIDAYFDGQAAARAFELHLRERQSIVQRERERQEAAGARAAAIGGGGAAAALAATALPRRIKGVYVRNIRHPNFQNLTFAQAEEVLRGKPAGEALIRPSSKGADRLSISWVWIEGQVKHMEILEQDKAPGALIGSKLVLRDQAYEDIDELMSSYVARCDDLVTEIIGHPKYRPDGEAEVEAELRAEKSREPSRIPYFICRVPQMPGYFQLMFLGNQTVHKERFEVTPDGFRMGKETLRSANDVIRRFKEAAAKAASGGGSRRQGARGAQQPPPPPDQPPPPPGPPPGGYGQQQYIPYQTGYQGYGYQQSGWDPQGQQGGGWNAQAGGQQGYGNGGYDAYGQQPPPPPGPPPPQQAS